MLATVYALGNKGKRDGPQPGRSTSSRYEASGSPRRCLQQIYLSRWRHGTALATVLHGKHSGISNTNFYHTVRICAREPSFTGMAVSGLPSASSNHHESKFLWKST